MGRSIRCIVSSLPNKLMYQVREADAIYVLFLLVLLSSMLVLILLDAFSICCLKRRAAGDAHRLRGSATADATPSRTRGSDARCVFSLPVFAYRCGENEGGVECAVCLSLLEDDGAGRILPECGHAFHAECIEVWLVSRSACPVCRTAVGSDASVVEGGGAAGVRTGLWCGGGVPGDDRLLLLSPLLLSTVP